LEAKSIDLQIFDATGFEWGKSSAFFQKNLTIWTTKLFGSLLNLLIF